MNRKIVLLILALAAAAGASLSTPAAEAACRKICCPNDPTACIECCSRPCPVLRCP
ncbi:MAG TPA: hypothetical protein VGG03_03170 [Thermoanaerobaculia bacterium]